MNEARKKCENDANCVFAKCKNFVKIFLGKNNSAKTINVIAATIDFAKRFFLFAANTVHKYFVSGSLYYQVNT